MHHGMYEFPPLALSWKVTKLGYAIVYVVDFF